MKCTWCKNEAVAGARLPEGHTGREYWQGCEAHEYLLDSLKLEKVDISVIELIERRERKAQQRKQL